MAVVSINPEENGNSKGRTPRRRAGGNHTMFDSQIREGLDSSQDSPRMTMTPYITERENKESYSDWRMRQ